MNQEVLKPHSDPQAILPSKVILLVDIRVTRANKLKRTKPAQPRQAHSAGEMQSGRSLAGCQVTHVVLTKAVPQFRQGRLAIGSPYDQLGYHGVIVH